jgi:signal transduction histidine kinase
MDLRDPFEALAVTLPSGSHLLIAQRLDEQWRMRHVLFAITGAGLAMTLILGLLGAGLISRRILQQVREIRLVVQQITAGNLSQRLHVDSAGRDFLALITSINHMLDRMQGLMHASKQTADDLSHALKSPLVRVRSRLEALQTAIEAPQRTSRLIDGALQEMSPVIEMVDHLLGISRIESGEPQSRFEPFPLAQCVQNVAELYRPSAEEKRQGLVTDIAAEPIVVGERHMIAEATANLIDNAVKFTPAGGRITVAVNAGDNGAQIVVSDSGPGIPANKRAYVLQRFARLPSAQSAPGYGLGLSLVNAVAQLHRGGFYLDDNNPGLRAVLTLPIRTSRLKD